MNNIEEKTSNTENVFDEDSLEAAREQLLKTATKKVSASARNMLDEVLTPMLETLSEEDCKAMTKLINEKGLLGAMMVAKKKRRQLDKNGADLTDGKVGPK